MVGDRRLTSSGLERNTAADFFHYCMAMSWPRLFAFYGAYFLITNVLFATLFHLGQGSVIGTRDPGYLDILFFSVQVFGTVSFGGWQPGSVYGHVIASIEIMLGILSYAFLTGLTFARFTRPKAELLFARNPVITLHNGKPTLMMRVANARRNYLTDAQAKLWIFANEEVDDGGQKSRSRRFYRTALLRDDNPLFIAFWVLYHVIDETSPLHGLSAQDLQARGVQLSLIVSGHDENFSQEVRGRYLYEARDIRMNERFVDIVERFGEDNVHFNYGLFHDTEPVPDAANRI